MMGRVRMPDSSRNMEISSNRLTTTQQIVHCPKFTTKKTLNQMKVMFLGCETSSQIAVFLLKLAALEIIRRLSSRKCPAFWQALQAMQVLTCPPLKWIQRWAPIKNLVNGLQAISRPLLFLSITTTLSDHSKKIPQNDVNSQADSSKRDFDDTPESFDPEENESFLVKLRKDLEKQGIVLPERINNDELRRFYIASNGDFSCFSHSLTKTIRWRETYKFLSPTELEKWAHFVFWHGYDVMLRPCLIIRLGLACSSVVSKDIPEFTHAIVSQIEQGVLSLLNGDDPRISVLMDCEGLSPFRFPTQLLTSCSTLLQDHYPRRLANFLIVRLPPVTRVISQAFIQVLKPTTRKKLKIEGEMCPRLLAELFQSMPSFLGGNCECGHCCVLPQTGKTQKLPLLKGMTVAHNKLSRETPDVELYGTLKNLKMKTIIGIIIVFLIFFYFCSFRLTD
ncbi:hypothetical protein ZOSMA_446G00090 [Zostera marina]|uniref:CRAL-TRIO domain-containing protein n=1 Tax=Zostera marina TaxID=29655 RepID=A0A0K9P3H0_ZOSMR|nr:hypothetical protein ZOSMA_446G00090 [Zostera marina]